MPPTKKASAAGPKGAAKAKSNVKKTSAKRKIVSKRSTKLSAAAKKTTAKKATAKKAPAKKAAAKKVAKKATAKKVVTKKAPAKKAVAKKATVKKAVSKKGPVRKAVAAATPGKATKRKPSKPSLAVAPPPPKPGQLLIGGITPYTVSKGEQYMNDDQKNHYREILMAWRTELMQEVDRTVHHMKDEAANFPDPNDRATQESEFGLELRTRDRERKLIKKINEAIALVDLGDYGYCETCGIEIGIRRLEARPTASLCIDCKTLDEIRERQMG